MRIRIIIEYDLDLNEGESLTKQHLIDERNAWLSGSVTCEDFRWADWPLKLTAEGGLGDNFIMVEGAL